MIAMDNAMSLANLRISSLDNEYLEMIMAIASGLDANHFKALAKANAPSQKSPTISGSTWGLGSVAALISGKKTSVIVNHQLVTQC